MILTRGANPIWFMNDLVGHPLDDTYFAFFLTNTLPYIPQAVYQDVNGLTPWSDPIQFQPNGGLPDNLYFLDGAVYRIEIRQGPDQNDSPLIYLIENYVPGSISQETADSILIAPNIVTNAQFSDVFFQGSITFATEGTYNIAPGWKLILTGTGTTTVTQVVNAGNTQTFGNPPYYLTLNNSGWTTVQLVQEFDNNGALFGGGAVAVSFLATATTTAQPVTVAYVPSVGPATDIFRTTVLTGGFNQYAGANDIPKSTNSDEGPDANVQIQFNMPGSSILSFTNIQILGQSTPLSNEFNIVDIPFFQEIPYERIVDQEFHIYRDSLLKYPHESLLTGWNFENNPWQFRSTANTNVATNMYTADQTIVIQQAYVASATGNNVSTARDTAANHYGFKVTAVTANNNFALLQYIDPATIRDAWGGVVSVMVKAFITTVHTSTVRFKMRLIHKAALPNAVSQTDPIATWAAGSDPVAAATYTLIAPPNDQIYTLSSSTPTQFSFDNITLPASTNDNMTLGILIYTIDNMNQAATADSITFNDISLVNNPFALPTQSETFDQTLRKCQYYYESSFATSQPAPGTGIVTVVGQRYTAGWVYFGGVASDLYRSCFNLKFNTIKCKNPTVKFYAPDSTTAGQVQVSIQRGGAFPPVTIAASNPVDVAITGWTATGLSTSNLTMIANSATSIMNAGTGNQADQGVILYHYEADSRLGI